MPRVYVSIGSNIEPEKNIRSAVNALRRRYGRVELSSVYRTKAVGFDGDDFYNLAARFETDDAPAAVKTALAQIEADHGRARNGARFSSRTLDLDLLLYGDLIRHDAVLDVPRAEILQCDFVLGPLAELAAGERHPENGERYDALYVQLFESRPLSIVAALSNI